ncbi:MAG: hypothetical protein DHS20C15_03460 [Planctomycetota bacterium]|nr:MAG: hypothetical protein DHS20C15_03460 [Planctomycetota bacterium]
MPETDTRQQTFQLVALGNVDKKRADAQLLIDAVPRMLASRSRDSREAQANLDAAKAKHQGFQAHLKSLELDLGAKEDELTKANGNLMSATSNEQYTLMMAEISRRKEEKGAVEEAILEQFDVIKQGERMVAEASARLAEAQQEYAGFEEKARLEIADHQKELAEFDERREQVRKAIAPEVLVIYDRAYKAHGDAIVPCEGNTCHGCFSTLTPNDQNRLLGGKRLMTCKVCQRILYKPDALHASPG